MRISNTLGRKASGSRGVYPQAYGIDWRKSDYPEQTYGVELPEVWMQAQASVQAQLDQEVFGEAADLAQSQWSEMTLIARLTQARGKGVDLVVSGIRCVGILTQVSASGEFILLQCTDEQSARKTEQLIRTDCINSARGLPRGLAPVAESLVRTRIGFREGSWLRGQWGNRVSIRIQGREGASRMDVGFIDTGFADASYLRGRVAAVGRDFIEMDNGEGADQRLVVALGSMISMKVAN